LLVKVATKYSVKFASIPLILLVTYVLLVQGEGLMGRPYDSIPMGKFEFLEYRVTQLDDYKAIEVWVLQKKKSRLYVIPYSEQMDQELARAKSKREKGSRMIGEFGEKKKGQLHEPQDLTMTDITPEMIMPPKEGEAVPQEPAEEKQISPRDTIKDLLNSI